MKTKKLQLIISYIPKMKNKFIHVEILQAMSLHGKRSINHKSPIYGAFSAERVGFEPTENLRLHRFSRPADSTTLAPLQSFSRY